LPWRLVRGDGLHYGHTAINHPRAVCGALVCVRSAAGAKGVAQTNLGNAAVTELLLNVQGDETSQPCREHSCNRWSRLLISSLAATTRTSSGYLQSSTVLIECVAIAGRSSNIRSRACVWSVVLAHLICNSSWRPIRDRRVGLSRQRLCWLCERLPTASIRFAFASQKRNALRVCLGTRLAVKKISTTFVHDEKQ